MSLPNLVMWSVALFIGVPAAWRNPTAGAMVLCWVFSEGLYAVTGNGLAVEFFIFPDLLVVAVIFAKPAAYCFELHDTTWDRVKCLWTERSVPDRIVMAIFPICWAIYASDLAPYYQWWGLWGLSIVQFLAAGWEGFYKLYRSRVTSGTPDYPSGDVFRRLVWSRGCG